MPRRYTPSLKSIGPAVREIEVEAICLTHRLINCETPDRLQKFAQLLSQNLLLFAGIYESKWKNPPGILNSSLQLTAVSELEYLLDWLQSLKQFFISVSYHIVVASLTLMALS